MRTSKPWLWVCRCDDDSQCVKCMRNTRTKREAIAAAEAARANVEAAWEVLTFIGDPLRLAAAMRVLRGEGPPWVDENGQVAS